MNAAWLAKNPTWQLHQTYKRRDRERGRHDTLSYEELRELLQEATCHYCEISAEALNRKYLRLDRKDSTLGHSVSNSVPCCTACNTLLGNLPYEGKVLLKSGLLQCRQQGFLATVDNNFALIKQEGKVD